MKTGQYATICTLLIFLTACHTDGSQTNIKINGLTELEQSKVFTPVTVDYNEKSKELSIGQVTISEGFPVTLSKVPAPNGEKTYVNSSVLAQYFFASSKSKQDIFAHYRSIGTKQGWKELKNLSNESSLVYETSKNEKLRVKTSDTIPESLSALKLSGVFVEVSKE